MEKAVSFGRLNNLVGVLTQPDEAPESGPVVILLNAGLLHRVGPNRLSVDTARRLAMGGVSTFRFDISGIGDSQLADADLLYVERSRRDITDAMEMLEEMIGADRFVLIGLCTGAFNAFRSAVADDRVVGCVFLDGYSYSTLRSRARHYGPRLLEGKRWAGYIRRKMRIGQGSDEPSQRDDLVIFETEILTKDRFASQLTSLVDRGTRMLFVYTGGGPQTFNYPRQLHDAFPQIDLEQTSTVRWYPDADHTYSLPGHRSRLLDDIDTWMAEEFTGTRAEMDFSWTRADGSQ